MTHESHELDRYAELAALADGSLGERRRAELEDEVAASPELRPRRFTPRRPVTPVRSSR